jgi:hypothetical protein
VLASCTGMSGQIQLPSSWFTVCVTTRRFVCVCRPQTSGWFSGTVCARTYGWPVSSVITAAAMHMRTTASTSLQSQYARARATARGLSLRLEPWRGTGGLAYLRQRSTAFSAGDMAW